MYWRLTPEERRIIERTRREGEQATPAPSAQEPSSQDWLTLARKRARVRSLSWWWPLVLALLDEGRKLPWRSIFTWMGGIALFVLFGWFMIWIGWLLGR